MMHLVEDHALVGFEPNVFNFLVIAPFHGISLSSQTRCHIYRNFLVTFIENVTTRLFVIWKRALGFR